MTNLSLFQFKPVEKMDTTDLEKMSKELKRTASKGKSWVVRRAARDDLELVTKELERRAANGGNQLKHYTGKEN